MIFQHRHHVSVVSLSLLSAVSSAYKMLFRMQLVFHLIYYFSRDGDGLHFGRYCCFDDPNANVMMTIVKSVLAVLMAISTLIPTTMAMSKLILNLMRSMSFAFANLSALKRLMLLRSWKTIAAWMCSAFGKR